MRKAEEDRRKLIEKAALLEKSWELNRECRKFLRENANTWEDKERREEREKERKKQEQIQKACWKKQEFEKKQQIKEKTRLITEMLEGIPKEEAKRLEEEVRKEENLELQMMGQDEQGGDDNGTQE